MTALGQSNFLQALGWAVLNSLWQLAFLWVLYQTIIALRIFTKASSRTNLATTLLFAGFAWFLATFVALLSGNAEAVAYSAIVTVEGNETINLWLSRVLPYASVVYLLLLVLPVWNFIRNYRYVQLIRKHALKKADVQWRMFVRTVAAQMGIKKKVQVWMSELVSSPVTIGYLKPIILLPLASINHLSVQQTEAVLLHELSHIRRFDYLVNLISRIIQTVLYFNPFVKAFGQIIEREREKSCDEMVMQFQYEPHGYASALLTLEKVAVAPSRTLAVGVAGGKKNELLGRIESILGIEKKTAFSVNRLAGVLAALICFVSFNALLIWSKPHRPGESSGILAQVTSPALLFGDVENVVAEQPTRINHTATAPSNQTDAVAGVSVPTAYVDQPGSESELIAMAAPALDPFQFVSVRENVLSKEEEKQVQEAIEASRRVLEEGQWKVVEKSIADALTVAEKMQVKDALKESADNANWEGMEEKLRQSYAQINWPAVKQELNVALAEIKLDSLQSAYNLALVNLAELQKELVKANEKSIPDTDLTLKSIELKKREVERVSNKLKSVRARKIIQL